MDVKEPSNWRQSRAELCARRLPMLVESQPLPAVTVVYAATFLRTIHEEQVQLVYAQIESLFEVGLLTAGNVEVHIVLSHSNEGRFPSNGGAVVSPTVVFEKVMEHIRRYSARPHLFTHATNGSMFDGLHHAWRLAKMFPNRYYLYLHNEGATQAKYPSTRRSALEMTLFREVVAPWQSVLRIFGFFKSSLQHLSLTPGATVEFSGFHWFNFWWARGAYLANNAEPRRKPEDGGHEAELWLGRKASRLAAKAADLHAKYFAGQTECSVAYSLKACNLGHCVTRDEALRSIALYERVLLHGLGIPIGILEPSNWVVSQAASCAGGLPHWWIIDDIPATVVYSASFVGSVQEEQMQLVYAQVESLFHAGLLTAKNVDVHVILSHGIQLLDQASNTGALVSSNAKIVFDRVTERILRYTSKAHIFYHQENRFEFFALHHLWNLSSTFPGRLYAYFHNKGATRHKFPGTDRTTIEMTLFREIIAPWRAVLRIFQKNARAQHLSLTPAVGGFHWFNFWWARGAHVASRVEPMVDVERHDYECWIGQAAGKDTARCWGGEEHYGKLKSTCSDEAYSLETCSTGTCFDDHGANLILNKHELEMVSVINGQLG